MNRTFYKKVVSTKGRVKYVPTHEYDEEFSHAMPAGCHLLVVKPGNQSRLYNVNPDTAALFAAYQLIKNDFILLLLKNSELRPKDVPITDEQKEAWNNLKESFGDSFSTLYGPSLNEVSEEFGKLLIEQASEMLKNPAVKIAWDKFQTIAVLTS